jgi:hypothetical protein
MTPRWPARPGLDHAAFEVETVEDMKNAADILWKNGVKTL